jgi:beta-glucosidase
MSNSNRSHSLLARISGGLYLYLRGGYRQSRPQMDLMVQEGLSLKMAHPYESRVLLILFRLTSEQAALFPCGISLASTWNLDLLHEVGQHLAEETKLRGAHVLLGPTVCMHRSPLSGRNFESFSEDPFLTGKLAASYIRGLQQKGVAATIKHFVGNEQETWRMTVDSIISERPLRELYLKPFEIAVREAKPWALMSAYNLINGVHADMNRHTLKDILRKEWSYDG